jgi:hypothetical protein
LTGMREDERSTELRLGKSSTLRAALVAMQVMSVGYYYFYFEAHGYLPAPFIYNKFDAFMDLYNSMWWGMQDFKYTLWGSVYPPLNFLILDVLRLSFYGMTTVGSSLDFRVMDIGPALLMCCLYLASPFVVVATGRWSILPPYSRILIACGAALSPPLLFAMERGNLILFALLTLPMAFSEKTIWRVLGVAILINLKPYFAVLLLAFPIAGDWRNLVQAIAASGALFVFTGLTNDPDFLAFIPNIFSFADSEQILSGREVLALPSSVSAFSYVIRLALKTTTSSRFPVDLVETIIPLIEVAKMAGLCALLASMLVFRNRLRYSEIVVGLIVIIVNLGFWVGGYSQIFYFACIPVLLGMRFRALHLAIVAAIFLPLDMIVLFTEQLGPNLVYPSLDIVPLDFQLGLGSVLRPLLNYALLFGLSLEFLARRNFAPATGKVSFA